MGSGADELPGAVCEAALAHVARDKAKASYFRSDLFELRRKMVNNWTKFATCKPAAVVQMHA